MIGREQSRLHHETPSFGFSKVSSFFYNFLVETKQYEQGWKNGPPCLFQKLNRFKKTSSFSNLTSLRKKQDGKLKRKTSGHRSQLLLNETHFSCLSVIFKPTQCEWKQLWTFHFFSSRSQTKSLSRFSKGRYKTDVDSSIHLISWGFWKLEWVESFWKGRSTNLRKISENDLHYFFCVPILSADPNLAKCFQMIVISKNCDK